MKEPVISKDEASGAVRSSAWLGRWDIPTECLFLNSSIKCQKNQAHEKSPNQQITSEMEIPSRAYCGGQPGAAAHAVENGVVRCNLGYVNENKANHRENKTEPTGAQYPKGYWGFTYYGDERDSYRQRSRGECGYMLTEMVKGFHFFFECAAQDFGFLWRYLVALFRHGDVMERPNDPSSATGAGKPPERKGDS